MVTRVEINGIINAIKRVSKNNVFLRVKMMQLNGLKIKVLENAFLRDVKTKINEKNVNSYFQTILVKFLFLNDIEKYLLN